MKIALVRYHDLGNINTRLPESLNAVRGVLPPLGLAYVASALLQAGFQVIVVDAPAMGYSGEEVRNILLRFAPKLVGVPAMTSTFFGALEACRIAHECGAVTVMGGVQLEIFPEETLTYESIDFGIRGEAEVAMVKLAQAIRDGTGYGDIPGLVYRDQGKVTVRDCAIIDDLDTIPAPARHLLPIRRYSSIISRHPVTTMIASRGCPWQCHFCFKQHADTRIRYRSPAAVLEEMRDITDRYGVREIMFYDDTFTHKREFILALCEQILSSGLRVFWEAPSRVDRVDREMLALMKRAGCYRLRFGVESGDQGILDLMNKKTTLDQIEKAFADAREAGMETFAYFMIGYLTETEATTRSTIRFARKIRPDLVMFTVATPYPGTPLYMRAQELGIIHGDYWREFILGTRSDRLPYLVDGAEKMIRQAYRSVYFDPSFVLRRVMRIRGMHDIANAMTALRGLLGFAVQPQD